MKKTQERLLITSIILYMISVFLFDVISFKFSSYGVVVLKLIALVLLLICYCKEKSKKTNSFAKLMIIMFIPYLWNNAFIKDGLWLTVFNYLFAIIYTILLSRINNAKKVTEVVLKVYYLFGLITAIVSWMEYVSIGGYEKVTGLLFSPSVVKENVYEFTARKNLCGLTSHYSRNAFYVMTAIMVTLFDDTIVKTKKRRLFSGLFLVATLLAIGKRGHVLFLCASILLSYVYFSKKNVKKIAKALILTIIGIISIFGVIITIPETRHTAERFITNDSSSAGKDLSNGRYQMYEDIEVLYKKNDYIPIGWGTYAASTDYYHPGLHNDYLQLFYEVGIIGVIMVLVPNYYFLIKSAKNAKKNEDSVAKLVLSFNIFFLLYAMTGIPHYDQEVYGTFFILNAIILNGDYK